MGHESSSARDASLAIGTENIVVNNRLLVLTESVDAVSPVAGKRVVDGGNRAIDHTQSVAPVLFEQAIDESQVAAVTINSVTAIRLDRATAHSQFGSGGPVGVDAKLLAFLDLAIANLAPPLNSTRFLLILSFFRPRFSFSWAIFQ
jgi:hypothetical protein